MAVFHWAMPFTLKWDLYREGIRTTTATNASHYLMLMRRRIKSPAKLPIEQCLFTHPCYTLVDFPSFSLDPCWPLIRVSCDPGWSHLCSFLLCFMLFSHPHACWRQYQGDPVPRPNSYHSRSRNPRVHVSILYLFQAMPSKWTSASNIKQEAEQCRPPTKLRQLHVMVMFIWGKHAGGTSPSLVLSAKPGSSLVCKESKTRSTVKPPYIDHYLKAIKATDCTPLKAVTHCAIAVVVL